MKKNKLSEINYTTPRITTPRDNKKGRVYISYNVDGIRYREYNGNRLGIRINPNRCGDEKEKFRQLKSLRDKFHNALKSGWTPSDEIIKIPSLREALSEILKDKIGSTLSANYKKNLIGTHKMFTGFLSKSELEFTYDRLKLHRVEAFLNQFRTSERNYINRRRCLGVFFNEIVRREWGKINLIFRTPTARAKAILHTPYSDDQLRSLLNYLKTTSPNLYLCCLLTYGCLLRPHQEVRQLKRKHVSGDYSQIMLSGSENKSGRVRNVFVPQYIQDELKHRLDGVSDPETNIFTLIKEPYSEGYFNLIWQRLIASMKEKGLLYQGQTIYSFGIQVP